MTDLPDIIQRVFPEKTVVVIGDMVADQFLHGTISRVSREAPVFILHHDETVTLPGAAANAAANVSSLGGQAVIIGQVGSDEAGEILIRTLAGMKVETDGIAVAEGSKTTTKVRVVAGQHYAARQQVIRIDYESSEPLSDEIKTRLRCSLSSAAEKADALIISDYNYGMIFPEIFEDALKLSRVRGIPLIVDSRYKLANFPNATTATPNREEVEQILGADFNPDQCSALRERLGLQALLVTNGNKGMSLFEAGMDEVRLPAVGSTEPVDVTGAGDTVIAAYALGLASGLSFREAAVTANHAGGIVVMKKGTATAFAGELTASLSGDQATLSSHAN